MLLAFFEKNVDQHENSANLFASVKQKLGYKLYNMKNAPVVVVRNRNENQPEKYRIRNLITGEISYSNSVTLLNPVHIPNVDALDNLKPEQIVRCDWALTGSLASYADVRRMTNKTQVETDRFGITLPRGNYYFESNHGPLKALHFSEKNNQRFVWLKK